MDKPLHLPPSPRPRARAALFALAAALAAPASPLTAQAAPVRLGVSEFADLSVNAPILSATERLLSEALGEKNLEVRTYTVAGLQAAAKAGDVDIIISSAGTYRRLALEGAGLVNLASVASDRSPDPNYADGSVFFVKKERADLQHIADLRGKTVAANHAYGFSGWQIALGELRRRGFDETKFFGAVQFQGHEVRGVIEAVRSGRADAGIVRSCLLEDLKEAGREFRVLDPREGDARLACAHSTDLYPNWTVSILPGTPPEVSRRVAKALFFMPEIENGLRWSVATDFRAVDRLLLELKIGPYAYLREFSLRRFVTEHALPIGIGLCLLAALLLHSVTVGWLVRRRTSELEEALEREKRLERERALAASRLEDL
ncbi:PhnD/SsuA/transferrin family substrate-binding protein [Mesosutterella sp. AGMB02718]|uniref:PhnD/SsuA/transferrin family substrate-binding protein n=1 Tax=Mesosutterella faecium TaxID=2925194 RepID=A0ABT7IQC1_9BURK|nr:PhnD/SsuA/transferrin family substrate-binding protein [Mesosutterella sp. AGMB02718]MDL2060165.1 PhnD/SsuA/transferrin family substrate-binding protein [Mesosutterella sp. AGMB02718]